MQMLNQLLEILTDSGLFYTDWKMIVMWLIGGILITMALGLKYKSQKMDKINGWILTTIFMVFLIYMGFFR